MPGHCVAQPPRHRFEDSGLKQEAMNVLGLLRKHLVHQIIQDVAVTARKARDKRVDLRLLAAGDG